jgi:ABC-type lipoprotein export system ATPase subunit
MKDSETIIKLVDICKDYPPNVRALCEVNLEIKKGDFISVIGRSGSGKSTMLHIIGLMDKPTRGKVLFEGVDATQLDEDGILDLRGKKIGFIFQAYNLFPELSALDNVAIAAAINGEKLSEGRKKAEKLLRLVELENRLYYDVTKLSGGEKQRVAVARALVNDPVLILGDEPTGNLDTKMRDEIMDLLVKLNEKAKKTVIVVTHDPEIAKRAKKIIRLSDGRIVTHGKTEH